MLIEVARAFLATALRNVRTGPEVLEAEVQQEVQVVVSTAEMHQARVQIRAVHQASPANPTQAEAVAQGNRFQQAQAAQVQEATPTKAVAAPPARRTAAHNQTSRVLSSWYPRGDNTPRQYVTEAARPRLSKRPRRC